MRGITEKLHTLPDRFLEKAVFGGGGKGNAKGLGPPTKKVERGLYTGKRTRGERAGVGVMGKSTRKRKPALRTQRN